MNKRFEAYVERLENIAHNILKASTIDKYRDTLLTALDGGPRFALNNSISIKSRRKAGIFFTNSLLAKAALDGVINQVDHSTVYMDPACGAGDLLLRCADALPVEDDLELTLHNWGRKLAGFDLHPEFVRAAKVRLFLAALLRSKHPDDENLAYSDRWFPLLTSGDCFEMPLNLQSASVIVMNPPYQLVESPQNCNWATGKVSNAALFVDYFVSNAPPNSQIVAILPDVLRSGSRYAGWRDHILKNAEIEKLILGDQFDQWTDVHVFILQVRITKSERTTGNFWISKTSELQSGKIGDEFEVHVGAVVPYRDKQIGKSYPYLVARNLPAWKTVTEISTTRKFSGTVYKPPFVVVRRTSRPEDKHRAIGTIISGESPVAVENHLLVLQPKDKTLRSCKRLLNNLREQETSDWLNNRIRCRHLTVSSLIELPWWSNSK